MDITSFSTYALSLSQDSIHIAFLSSCSFSLFPRVAVSQLFLVFHDLELSMWYSQLPCRRSSMWILWSFLMIKLSIFFTGKNSTEVISLVYHIRGLELFRPYRWYYSWFLGKVAHARLLHWKVTISSLVFNGVTGKKILWDYVRNSKFSLNFPL